MTGTEPYITDSIATSLLNTFGDYILNKQKWALDVFKHIITAS